MVCVNFLTRKISFIGQLPKFMQNSVYDLEAQFGQNNSNSFDNLLKRFLTFM